MQYCANVQYVDNILPDIDAHVISSVMLDNTDGFYGARDSTGVMLATCTKNTIDFSNNFY